MFAGRRVTAERAGHGRAQDDPESDGQHGGGDPATAANTRSTHGSMMPEHVFGVKGWLEHMFASPPDGC